MRAVEKSLILETAIPVPVSTPPDLNTQLTGTLENHARKIRPHLGLVPVFGFEWVGNDIYGQRRPAVVLAFGPWGFAGAGLYRCILGGLGSVPTQHTEIHPSGKRVWVRDCWVGDAAKGIAYKDYKVKP